MSVFEFFKKKWVFKKNKTVDLLLLDGSQIKFKFHDINYEIYDSEKINFRYFIPAIINFIFSGGKKNISSLRDTYFKILINSYNPKLALSSDRNGTAIRFKKHFSDKILIVYEWGYTFNDQIEYTQYVIQGYPLELAHSIIKGNLTKPPIKISPDYYLVFDNRSLNFIKKIFKSKFYIAGSVKNNEKELINKDKIYDFMFISCYRPDDIKQPQDDNEPKRAKKFNNNIAFALKAVSDFCTKNKKKYCIATALTRLDKKEKKMSISHEIKFINSYADNFSIEKIDSFNLAAKSKVFICTHSLLGYELLSRGNKVFFINTDLDYKWHFFDNKNSGPFWYCGKDISTVHSKLQIISELNDSEWTEILEKTSDIMKFDRNNTILKKLINEVLENNRKYIQKGVSH